MIKRLLRNSLALLLTSIFLIGTTAFVALAQDEEIIASLQRISGSVSVVQAANQQVLQGRNGLLLRAGDTVKTAANARATIKFRNGSEIRLFPRTEFRVEAEEEKGKKRTFKFNLFSKLGSFWGNFVKRRQVASIRTPTATIGIKGTTLRVVERDGKARVALTEGLIDVSNDRDKVELRPGKRITDFTRTDTLANKIEDIPFKLDLKSEKKKLEFRGDRSEEVFLTIQLVNIKSGAPVRRSGPVYLRSNYDKITYPVRAQLDERGFARVALQMAPPEAADSRLNGNVYVWAVMDQEDADDTSEGRILFTVPVPAGSDRIRIESESGEAKRVQ